MVECNHADDSTFNEWDKCQSCGIRREDVCLKCESLRDEIEQQSEFIDRLLNCIASFSPNVRYQWDDERKRVLTKDSDDLCQPSPLETVDSFTSSNVTDKG